MTDTANYFQEYNKRPKRKKYLADKARKKYRQHKKGTGKIICPNCLTVCELSLEVKKNN